jgi:hypothetical protein
VDRWIHGVRDPGLVERGECARAMLLGTTSERVRTFGSSSSSAIINSLLETSATKLTGLCNLICGGWMRKCVVSAPRLIVLTHDFDPEGDRSYGSRDYWW